MALIAGLVLACSGPVAAQDAEFNRKCIDGVHHPFMDYVDFDIYKVLEKSLNDEGTVCFLGRMHVSPQEALTIMSLISLNVGAGEAILRGAEIQQDHTDTSYVLQEYVGIGPYVNFYVALRPGRENSIHIFWRAK